MTDFVRDGAAEHDAKPILARGWAREQHAIAIGLCQHTLGAGNRCDRQRALFGLWDQFRNRPALVPAFEQRVASGDEYA